MNQKQGMIIQKHGMKLSLRLRGSGFMKLDKRENRCGAMTINKIFRLNEYPCRLPWIPADNKLLNNFSVNAIKPEN